MNELPSLGAWGLRRVRPSDARYLIQLRATGEYSRFLHPISTSIREQEDWIREDAADPTSDYFVLVHDGHPRGFVGLTSMDRANGYAEWGRWILESGSLGAVPSLWLIYSTGFDHYGLDFMYCRTAVGNTKVLSIHDECGLIRVGQCHDALALSWGRSDALVHMIERSSWPDLSQRLRGMAMLIERR